MAIELTFAVPPDRKGEIVIRGAVAHLGQSIPEGKEGTAGMQDRSMARHHGKIFYAYNSYHYINLTERPTQVFRGPNFSFQLDPLMPQCEVHVGDQLKLGTAVFEITGLTPPPPKPKPQQRQPVAERFECRGINCGQCPAARACEVIGVTSGLIDRLHDYTEPKEILRASVDWLVGLFKTGSRIGELKVSRAHAIAIRPREGAGRAWSRYRISIDKGLSNDKARVDAFEKGALDPEQFDLGAAFRFTGKDTGVSGIAAGVLEGIRSIDVAPHAGHFLFVQLPESKRATRDDICVVHHTAGHLSKLLTTVEAARIRKQHELERKAAKEGRCMFHEMIDLCGRTRKAVATARGLAQKKPKALTAELADVDNLLNELQEYIARGRWASNWDGFRYEWTDLRELCQSVFDNMFGRSKALKQTKDWKVHDRSDAGNERRGAPCYPFGIKRVVYGLVSNSNNAIAKCKGRNRIHIVVDNTMRHAQRYARIRVLDDGPGMMSEALTVIFEGRFSTARGRRGVGTQNVADQVRQHYGFIEVASTQGMGTVVGVLLPAPVSGAEEPEVDRSWLEPYIKLASENRLVTRSDLESLLNEDKFLRAWYRTRKGVP